MAQKESEEGDFSANALENSQNRRGFSHVIQICMNNNDVLQISMAVSIKH